MPTPRLRASAAQLTQANHQALAAAPLRGDIDPSRTAVFQKGADGKLHPIPGWTITGPFDFGRWSRNINWPGAIRDLGLIAASSVGGGGLQGLISRRAVTGVVGDGLTAADAATLGAGTYVAGDRTWESMEPKQKPKHW